LNDITNVAGSRASQAYSKVGKQSIVAEATARAELALSSAQTASNENAQNVSEYAAEIYANAFRDEAAYLARSNYMESQADINGKMRAILIDWLVEVHLKYKMRNETLFLTVNLIDRYLSRAQVVRKRLQLVGVVAMFVASKFEEINPPEVKDFVHITDNAYTKDEVLLMECSMLTTLNFRIVAPLATVFFEKLQRANRCDQVHTQLAEYLVELGLLDLRMLSHTPSHIVSAALLLSNELLGKRPLWPATMVQQSRQTEQALHGCVEELRELLEAAPKGNLQAVRKKFAMPQHHGVARMSFSAAGP
jgi:cyclin B